MQNIFSKSSIMKLLAKFSTTFVFILLFQVSIGQPTTQFPISFLSDTLETCQGQTLVHNTTGGFVQYSYSFSIESSPGDAGFVVIDVIIPPSFRQVLRFS